MFESITLQGQSAIFLRVYYSFRRRIGSGIVDTRSAFSLGMTMLLKYHEFVNNGSGSPSTFSEVNESVQDT